MTKISSKTSNADCQNCKSCTYLVLTAMSSIINFCTQTVFYLSQEQLIANNYSTKLSGTNAAV